MQFPYINIKLCFMGKFKKKKKKKKAAICHLLNMPNVLDVKVVIFELILRTIRTNLLLKDFFFFCCFVVAFFYPLD